MISNTVQFETKKYLSSKQLPQHNTETEYVSLVIVRLVLYNLQGSGQEEEKLEQVVKRSKIYFKCKEKPKHGGTSGAIHL